MFHPRNCPHDSAPAQPQRERKTPTRSHTRGGPLGQFSLAFLAPATNNECPVAATFGNAKNHKCNSMSCQSVCAQCSDTTSSVQPIQNAMDKMQHEMKNRQLKTHEMQTRNGARAGQNATRNGARARQNATRNGEQTMTKTHGKGMQTEQKHRKCTNTSFRGAEPTGQTSCCTNTSFRGAETTGQTSCSLNSNELFHPPHDLNPSPFEPIPI